MNNEQGTSSSASSFSQGYPTYPAYPAYPQQQPQAQGYSPYYQPQAQPGHHVVPGLVNETSKVGEPERKLVAQPGGFVFISLMALIAFEALYDKTMYLKRLTESRYSSYSSKTTLILAILGLCKATLLISLYARAMIFPKSPKSNQYIICCASIATLAFAIKAFDGTFYLSAFKSSAKALVADLMQLGFLWAVFCEEDANKTLARAFKPWINVKEE